MRKSLGKYIQAAMLVIALAVMLTSAVTYAGSAIYIKVPTDAQLYVKGVLVGDDHISEISTLTGRIHEIAASQTGMLSGYKTYAVYNLSSPDEIEVLDAEGASILPSYAMGNTIEYAGGNTTLAQQVTSRVTEAACIFVYRTSGSCGNAKLAQYFLNGSDAYIKAVNSDGGRKWGQFVRTKEIQTVDVSEVYAYGSSAFTAKATITATATGYYTEQFDLYMLFQKNGSDYYVTNFTYMP